MMKKLSLFIICVCFSFVGIQAQKHPREKIRTYKVAYITEKLNLSKDEAEKFWPIYNTFEEQMKQHRSQKLRSIKQMLKGDRIDNISEAEAEDMLAEINNVEEKFYAERKKYKKALQKVLPAKKILLLKKVEDDFNKKLLNRLRHKREKRFNKN